MRVLEKAQRVCFGRRALPRLDARKKRAGDTPPRASRTGQDLAIPTYRLLQRYVGRGPVPRRASDYRSPRGGQAPALRSPHGIAGDRPPRYCNAPFISPASPPQTSSTHDAQATQGPATDASTTSPVYHQTRPPRFDSNAQHPASQTYR